MPRSRLVLALLALVLLVFFVAGDLGTSVGAPRPGGQSTAFVPGEVLVKFTHQAEERHKASARADVAGQLKKAFKSKAEHWQLGPGKSVEQAIQRLRANPNVEYAEPNYILTADVVPNDPRFGEMWQLRNTGQTGGTPGADIDATLAWGVSVGSPNVLIGVIDTGCDYNHPDLATNIWTNPGEIPGNWIDDDGNGFVDDVHGYDFYNSDGDPFDDHGHGTHTSGTIGALGDNGVGITGINWNVKIVCIKFLSSGGSGSTAGAISSVDYATQMGVDLTSNSWGGGGFSQALYDSIANAGVNEMAFVAAAGNSGVNTDTSPNYPSSYDLANIVAVAATDNNDGLASFSNYGAVTVDLGAPGVDTLSTLPGGSYGTNSGTSMACPHVAGVMGLMRALSPTVPVAQMKARLLAMAEDIPSLAGKCVSNGRLNAFFTIAEPDIVPPGAVADLATVDPGSNTMGLVWTATGDDGVVGTANFYEIRYSPAPIDETNWALATRAGNEPTPQVSGSPEYMEVRGLAASTFYYFALKAFDEWGNAGPVSNLASGTTLPPPTGSVAPTSVSAELYTGQQTDRQFTLSNIGAGTLDFTIPTPAVGEPMSAVPQEPLLLGKDETDPRHGDPVIQGSGGPDGFGYRWMDSDEPGGPAFNWVDISTTGTAVAVSGDDSTSSPMILGFNFPLYGTFFDSVRICTNGWASLTSTATSYSNQPLPNSGAPENLIAPFWDDLTATAGQIFFQSFGTSAIIQWNGVPPYSGTGAFTFQAILDSNGAITYQYLTMSGATTSATVGIQDATKMVGLQVAFNQAYIHDGLAVRIASIPQWLTAFPISGRLRAGESKIINLHMNASGLEGGTYPGVVSVVTNDPAHPTLVVNAALHVIGAPQIGVQPSSLAYGDVFVGVATSRDLIVANPGTDTLHVTGITPSDPTLTVSESVFDIPPKGSRTVQVIWTPAVPGAYTGSLTIESNDASTPSLIVPVAGNGLIAPQMVTDPTSLATTLFTGQQEIRPLTVYNTCGSDLIVNASADQGGGIEVVADEQTALGSGGPDTFGYRWKDSDASGGPTFDFVDISTTGTQISFSSSDDGLSAAIAMGMTFPFYGSNFTSLKVGTNGFLTFDTTDTSTRLSNYNLPNTSGAKFMLALLWDDLHLRTGNVKYKLDGTRFIVQYTNVEKYSPSGNPMTFQVQLYPNGKILYMYKTMPTGGTYNSLTIGIQDGTKTIGLTANYNANYVHANMAIQFSRTPDWLTVTPASATIPPGGNAVFNVKFDSTDRVGGVLHGNVVLRNNLPETRNIPTQLTIIGVPIASIVPTSFAYGTKFVGYPYLTTVQVVNTGTDVLTVTDVTTNHGSLTVSEPATGEIYAHAAFPLPPGQARLFSLRWLPTLPGALPPNAAVAVYSNDPVNPIKTMPVSGTAIMPPIAVWSPPSFTDSLLSGEIVTHQLHLENQGGSDLTYTAEVRLVNAAAVPVFPPVDLKKDEIDENPGVLGSGGPDAFGYRWRDSDSLAGPVFGWVDISAIGTPITAVTNGTLDDGNAQGIPIGFNFPFYGGAFGTVNVCTNGWLSFTSTSTSLSNSGLPSTGAPENLLAAFWDDLDLRTAGTMYYYNDGGRFIMSYVGVYRYGTTLPYTFQTILYPNGKIVFQYLDMQGTRLNEATIGIQDSTMTDGLTVVYNAAYMHNGLAVEFNPPAGWLDVTPRTGAVPAGGFVDLNVAVNSTGLIGGDYLAYIALATNDPARGLIQVPVNLHVTGVPHIGATPASLTFPMTYVGYSRTLPLSIRNTGTDVLHVTGVSVSGDFSQTGLTTPVSIPVYGSIPVTVQFSPTVAGNLTGSITVTSDDPNMAELVIPLDGLALDPPIVNVAPSSITEYLAPGTTSTRDLTVCNTGGSDLVWTGSMNLLTAAAAVTHYPELILGKEDPDPRPGILGSGGPDLFGYRWKDSDEPGGPAFNWVDISGVGTRVVFSGDYCDDCNRGPFPIGAPIKFYGNTFNQFYVTTNGWVSFTSTLGTYTNQPLPNSGSTVPENLLAPFWDDLVHRAEGDGPYPSAIYYYFDGTRLIVSFEHFYRIAAYADDLNFQVIIYPSGKVVYQYATMLTSTLNSATIGIQNATKDDGLTVVFNDVYIHEDMAIEFKALPEWAIVSPTSGTIPAGECQTLTASLDATDPDLLHGLHEGFFRLASNDPATPTVDVPVQLYVNNRPMAVPGTPQMIECTGNLSAMAMLDGTWSTDADGDPLTYLWSAPGITFDDPTSPTPTASFPLGTTVVTLVVNDGYQTSDPATVAVTVVDTVPPVITSTVQPSLLWPPNHKMSNITATVTATDICYPTVAVVLTSATSNEPDDAQGGGDGNTTNDIQGAAIGTPDFQVMLRAEREGTGMGRVYTLTYTATDGSGNAALTSSAVSVPHDHSDMAAEPINVNLENGRNTRVVWNSVPVALHYDVIRGDLANFAVEGSDLNLGAVTCIVNHTTATTTAGYEDTAIPAPGHVFFYAVQFNNGQEDSSYGTVSANKARVVRPGNGDCQ